MSPCPKCDPPRVLSDDFIDEAQIRFARSTTKELARYIEATVLRVTGYRPQVTLDGWTLADDKTRFEWLKKRKASNT